MRSLTGTIGAILDGAPWTPRYASRFAARRAVVLACVNHGWTLDECHLILLAEDSACAYLWDGEGRESPRLRLTRDYNAARARFRDAPSWQSANDVRQWLGEVTAKVQGTRWPGRTGRTDQAVMLAVLSIASEWGTYRPALPSRDVAQRAGVTRRTVDRALQRLCDAGWLRRTAKAGDGYAGVYLIRESQHLSHNDPYHPVGLTDGMGHDETRLMRHETFVRLGKAATALYAAVCELPGTVQDLVRRTGVSRATAYRQLPRLESAGLLVSKNGEYLVGPATPDTYAEAMGWMGDNSITETRRQQAAEDREEYRAIRERYGKRDAMRRADELRPAYICPVCSMPFDRSLGYHPNCESA